MTAVVSTPRRGQAADWLQVALHSYGTASVLRLTGELDVATSPLLQECLDMVLHHRRTPQVRRLVVDASGLAFVDASGLCPLLHARAVLKKRGGELEVRHPSPAMVRVMLILGLDWSAPGVA